MLFLFSLPCVEHIYPASLSSLVKPASLPICGKNLVYFKETFLPFLSFCNLSSHFLESFLVLRKLCAVFVSDSVSTARLEVE